MTKKLSLRAARLDDLPTLLEFEQGVIRAERPHAQNLKEGAVTYYNLPELIDDDKAELLVAQSDTKLVGSGYVRIEASKPQFVSEQHGYLGFMYVDPQCRGRGVSQIIMNGLFDWAEQRGVHTFLLDVYVGNLAAIKAYQRVGFRANLLEMVLSR